MINVYNVKDACTIETNYMFYCGRNANKYPYLINADLGNPHIINTDNNRNDVCKLYEKDLEDDNHPHWQKIKDIALLIHKGKTVALFCHCKPKQCHCDFIEQKIKIQVALLNDRMNPFIPIR